MPRYGLGSGVRVTTPQAITDATGTAVNPATIKLTLQKPDATTVDYLTPTNTGTGLYRQDIPKTDLTLLGHYQYVWTATSPDGVSPPTGFEINDPFEVTVLSLQDAKDTLDKSQLKYDDDAELLRFVATIEGMLERITGGPIVNRTISNERVKVGNGYRTIALRYRPLVSVTSIVDIAGGSSLPLTDLDPDYATGVLRRKLQLPFWSRGPYYLVTYVAGLGTAVPPAVTSAAGLILADLWATQRGGSVAVPSIGSVDTVTVPAIGYPVSRFALQLLAPYALEAYV